MLLLIKRLALALLFVSIYLIFSVNKKSISLRQLDLFSKLLLLGIDLLNTANSHVLFVGDDVKENI